MLFQQFAATDEGAGARQSLPAGMHGGHNVLCVVEIRRNAAPAGAMYGGGVSFVQYYTRAVTFGEPENFAKRHNITIHAENRLGNDQLAARFALVPAQ